MAGPRCRSMMCVRTYIAKHVRMAEHVKRNRAIFLISTVLCLFFLGVGSVCASLHMTLEEDRIWLDAEQVSIHSLMERFAHLGVRVRMDPSIDDRITARFGGVDLERALSQLLDSYGYILIWDMLDGPLGRLPRLSEIQVFRPGRPEQAQDLFQDPETFRVVQAGDGSGVEFIADEIIIGFALGSDPRAIRILIREIGGSIVESIPELGIYRIRLPPGSNILAIVDQLRRNPLVGAVEPNYAYRLPRPVSETGRNASGTGIARPPSRDAAPVAVLDSGLTRLAELEGFIAGGFNALQPDQDAADRAGHGTQMALIASGVTPPGGVVAGQGVPVLGIRTFDDNGVTSNFAMMRSVLHAASEGARVLNLSWGSPVASEFLEMSMAAARRRGMILVAAAGNEPLGRPVYPAGFDGVVAVSAVLPDGTPWPQSNFGDFVTVAAPGTATFPIGFEGAPGAYVGTSIASAFVSHALGLYMQKHPRATPQQAILALRAAVQGDSGGRNPHTGSGVLDAAALQRLLQ